MEAWFLFTIYLSIDHYHPAVHDHTKSASPALNIAASWGDGGHFPPLVGAMRRIHLGASLRSFQLRWDSSSSCVAVGSDFVASVFSLFVWEEDPFSSVSVPNCRLNDVAEPFRNDGIRQLVFGCCHRLRPITLEESRRVVSWRKHRELRPNDRFNIVAAYMFCF